MIKVQDKKNNMLPVPVLFLNILCFIWNMNDRLKSIINLKSSPKNPMGVIYGKQLTKDDIKVYGAVLEQPNSDLYPNANQW